VILKIVEVSNTSDSQSKKSNQETLLDICLESKKVVADSGSDEWDEMENFDKVRTYYMVHDRWEEQTPEHVDMNHGDIYLVTSRTLPPTWKIRKLFDLRVERWNMRLGIRLEKSSDIGVFVVRVDPDINEQVLAEMGDIHQRDQELSDEMKEIMEEGHDNDNCSNILLESNVEAGDTLSVNNEALEDLQDQQSDNIYHLNNRSTKSKQEYLNVFQYFQNSLVQIYQ
jgi:hypothetical protein